MQGTCLRGACLSRIEEDADFGAIILALAFSRWIKKEHMNTASKFIGYFMLILETFYFLYMKYSGAWTLATGLPLHMCDVAIIIGGLLMITKKQIKNC